MWIEKDFSAYEEFDIQLDPMLSCPLKEVLLVKDKKEFCDAFQTTEQEFDAFCAFIRSLYV